MCGFFCSLIYDVVNYAFFWFRYHLTKMGGLIVLVYVWCWLACVLVFHPLGAVDWLSSVVVAFLSFPVLWFCYLIVCMYLDNLFTYHA